MNIIHFRNKLNERIQKIVSSPDFEPHHLEDAEAFAEALRDAFKFIRHTAGDDVIVTKAEV